MAISYGFFNAVKDETTGKYDRTYDADDMSNYYKGLFTKGVVPNVNDEMKVTAGTGMTVNVGTGRAIIDGKWIEVTEAESLTLEAGDSYLIAVVLDEDAREITIVASTSFTLSNAVLLATVKVPEDASSMSDDYITDNRGANWLEYALEIKENAELEEQVTKNTEDIATNTSNIATNASNIATNASNIATNTKNIATNASNIATNASAIEANTTAIETVESSLTSKINNVNSNLTSSIDTLKEQSVLIYHRTSTLDGDDTIWKTIEVPANGVNAIDTNVKVMGSPIPPIVLRNNTDGKINHLVLCGTMAVDDGKSRRWQVVFYNHTDTDVSLKYCLLWVEATSPQHD